VSICSTSLREVTISEVRSRSDLLTVSLHSLFKNIPNPPEVQFAEHIKKAVPDFLIGAVGIITEPEQANDILENGQADIAFFARQVLRDIDFPLRAAQELGVAVNPSLQYGAAWSRMLVPRKPDEVHHSEAAEHGTQRGEGEVEGEESEKTKGGRGSKCPPPVYASVP
jgi:tRNA-dihydrouridine synthase